MDQSAQTPPAVAAESIAPPPPESIVITPVVTTPADSDVPDTHGTVTNLAPAPAKQNMIKKPIFIVVASMVLFCALCAVAIYAYSQSN